MDSVATVILRCTTKMLNLLRVNRRVEEHPASPEDWYANLLRINTRKCLLVTHATTLYSVFVPDVLVADLRPLARASSHGSTPPWPPKDYLRTHSDTSTPTTCTWRKPRTAPSWPR